MSPSTAGKALIAAALLLVLVPASASAWTVTIRVHGAGTVSEVANRFGETKDQMNCTVGPTGRSNSSVTNCVGGSASGLYNSGNIVRLMPSVSGDTATRGWRFDHWTDSNAGGFINCDPQDTTGDFSSPVYCEFQIFENLTADLYFKDSTGPSDTAISGGPTQGSTTNATTAKFVSFSAASDPDATFQCRLDPPGSIGSWGTCPQSGATFNNLTQNGTWQLNVRGVDPSGNVDTTPAVRSWIVDTIPPVVQLTGGPGANTTTKTQTADFGVSTSDGNLVCTIDGAPLTPCSPPTAHVPALSDGQHTFAVRGVDAVGNASASITRTWTVDTTPPTVTVSGGPTGTTTATSATFTVTPSDGTAACTLDGASTPCAGAHDNLADGQHTFAATATDAVGNTSAPVTHTWTVDTTPPTVTVSGGPTGPTNATSATFTVTTNEGTATCLLDGDATPCAGAHAGLADGAHTFTATAVDGVGNVSAPVSRHWTVDTVAPDVSLLNGPADGSTTTSSTASFTFQSTDASATFQCKLDLAAFAACPSPTTFAGVPNGDHTFSVRAIDAAGNASAPVTRSWTVQTVNQGGIPDQDGDGVLASVDCNDLDAAIHPGATDIPGDGIDQNCDGKDATLARVPGALRRRFSPHGAKTTILVLKLTGLTAPRTSVTVSCKGKGCRFSSLKAKPTKSHTLDVRRLLPKAGLKAGQTLTIKISAPGYRAVAAKFTVRRGKAPKGGAFVAA